MIKLKEAVLIRFGKFKNTSFKFEEGMQVFYGANEAGKSTLQTFIKAMLYDVPSRKKAGEVIKDRDRIIPWDEKNAEGILRLEADNRLIEIHKKFGKTASGDKTEVLDANTGDIITEYSAENLGEQLLGVSLNVFEKTFWLCQDGACFSGKDEELHKRLMNLQSTGDEDVSAEKTLKELEKLKRSIKAKDKRGTEGSLDRLLRLRDEKVRERYGLMEQMQQRKSQQKRLIEEKERLDKARKKEEELNALLERQDKLRALDNRLKKWEQAEKLSSAREKALGKSEYINYRELTDDDVKNAEYSEEKIKTLDRNANIEYDKDTIRKNIQNEKAKEKTFKCITYAGIGALVLALVLAALRLPYWGVLSISAGLLGLAALGSGGMQLKKAKSRIAELNNSLNSILQTEAETNTELEKVKADLDALLKKYKSTSAEELRWRRNLCIQTETEAKGLTDAYNSLMEGEDIDALKSDAKEAKELLKDGGALIDRDIKGEIRETQKIQNDAIRVIGDIEGKIAYVFSGGSSPADCETEISYIDAEISGFEKKLKAAELAEKVFSSVYEKRKSDFAPRVNEKVNEFLDILTMGRYNNARVSEEYRLRLEDTVEAEYLSRGTYEQVYFALRLALSKLIGKGDEPLFLDDFMTAYDDRRSMAAMELLREIAAERQVLLFTCHGRDADNAKKLEIAINYLEEETENGC